MAPSAHVAVRIDLARVRANVAAIKAGAGVDLLAVVKADAYGLGAAQVIRAIDDLADGYCFFGLAEVLAAGLRDVTRKPAITLGPPGGTDPQAFRRLGVRPAVAGVRDAALLRAADPILAVDTGQQRFACPPAEIDAALRAGGCREAMTHAATAGQVRRLVELAGGRGLRLHAAGSSLLADPAARLDAVRPGLALYRGAVRVAARLVEVRDSVGPAGYTGFVAARHGVVLCGYANGLRPGPCAVNGRGSRILEVGMQSAFVECAPGDRVGDEVALLGNTDSPVFPCALASEGGGPAVQRLRGGGPGGAGTTRNPHDSVTEDAVAAAWGTSPHAVLVQLAGAGVREWAGP